MKTYFTGSIPVHVEMQVLLGSWLLDRAGFDLDSPVGFELVMELFRKPTQRAVLGSFDDGWVPMRLSEDLTKPESFRRWFTPYALLVSAARGFDAQEALDLAHQPCRDGVATTDDFSSCLENLAPLARLHGASDPASTDKTTAAALAGLYTLAFDDGDDYLRQLLLLAPAQRRIPEHWHRFRNAGSNRRPHGNFAAFRATLMRRIGAEPSSSEAPAGAAD